MNRTPFSLSSAFARRQNGQNLQVYISTVVMPESEIDLFIYSFWVDIPNLWHALATSKSTFHWLYNRRNIKERSQADSNAHLVLDDHKCRRIILLWDLGIYILNHLSQIRQEVETRFFRASNAKRH